MRGIFLAILLGLSGVATAQTEIEYAYPDQSIWTTRLNEKGEPDNPLLRLAAELFSRAGIPWHGQAYPSARLFHVLQEGKAPFSMLVKSPALQECCLLSKKPVARAEIRVYHRGNKAPIRSLEELAGKSVIIIRGYSYGGLMPFLTDQKNHIRTEPTHAHSNAFAMLEAGRADYLVDYSGPATEVLKDRPVSGLQFEVLSRQDVFLVLSKQYPESARVMQRLETIAAGIGGRHE